LGTRLHDRRRDRRHRPLPLADQIGRLPDSARASASPANPTGAARSPNKAPRFLYWALIEATNHACRHPLYKPRYERTKARLGKQRGGKVARVELARTLAHAIWHMLTRNQPFAPASAASPLARRPTRNCATGAKHPTTFSSHQEAIER